MRAQRGACRPGVSLWGGARHRVRSAHAPLHRAPAGICAQLKSAPTAALLKASCALPCPALLRPARLEVPAEPGEVQEEFNIDKEGSFIITVKVGEARLVECESRRPMPTHLHVTHHTLATHPPTHPPGAPRRTRSTRRAGPWGCRRRRTTARRRRGSSGTMHGSRSKTRRWAGSVRVVWRGWVELVGWWVDGRAKRGSSGMGAAFMSHAGSLHLPCSCSLQLGTMVRSYPERCMKPANSL